MKNNNFSTRSTLTRNPPPLLTLYLSDRVTDSRLTNFCDCIHQNRVTN